MEKEELLLIHGTEYKEMTKEILYACLLYTSPVCMLLQPQEVRLV